MKMKSLEKKIETIAKRARAAATVAAKLSTEIKNKLLEEITDSLLERKKDILRENQKDLKAATTTLQRQGRVEGKAPWALPTEGATRAPTTVADIILRNFLPTPPKDQKTDRKQEAQWPMEN